MINFTLPGKSLFSPPKPQLPPEAPALPTENDAEVKKKATASRIRAQGRKGLLSTDLTSGSAADTDPNAKQKKLG